MWNVEVSSGTVKIAAHLYYEPARAADMTAEFEKRILALEKISCEATLKVEGTRRGGSPNMPETTPVAGTRQEIWGGIISAKIVNVTKTDSLLRPFRSLQKIYSPNSLIMFTHRITARQR